MPLGSWEPNFSWDDAPAGHTWTTWSHQHSAITALYECLKDALGPPVTMDEGRQDKTRRRKDKDKTEESTNDNISYQAAKMTKCIVNYMAAGSDQHIIDYDFEYDLEIENVITARDMSEVLGEDYEGFYELGGMEYETGILLASHGWIRDDTPGVGAGVHDIDIDLDWEIYEEINYMAAPVGTISIGLPPDQG